MPATTCSDTPPTSRLVIRVKLIPQEPPQPPARRLNRPALLLILAAVALALASLGIGKLFESGQTSPAAEAAKTPSSEAPSENRPVTEAPVTRSVEAKPRPVEPEVQQRPDAPLAPINKAVPEVPRSALQTIRGTIRVSVRVGIDKRGTVVDATTEDRGPSRYFERLALASAKKWTFTPANLEERRSMLLRFNYTRAGATAEASPLPPR